MANKTWMITGVVVVAAAVAFIALRGPKMENQGTPGTIGAANRYQSEQIGSGDVSLDNPQVAEFIQSDVFRKLATDKAFRDALRSDTFDGFIASAGLRDAAARVDVAAVMRDAAFRDLLKTEAFTAAVESGSLTEALRTTNLARLTEAGHLDGLLKMDALRELALRQDFQRLAEAATKQEAASITDLNKIAESMHADLLKTEAFRTLEANRDFQDALKDGIMGLFQTPESARFATEGLRTLVDLKSFDSAMRLDGFARLAEGMRADNLAAVRDVAMSDNLLAVLSSATFRDAASRAEMGMVMDAGLKDAMARVTTE